MNININTVYHNDALKIFQTLITGKSILTFSENLEIYHVKYNVSTIGTAHLRMESFKEGHRKWMKKPIRNREINQFSLNNL